MSVAAVAPAQSFEPGFWDVDAETYHEDRQCVSNTQVGDFKYSPALYYGRHLSLEFPFFPTKSIELGDIFHEFVLEPQRAIDATNFGNGTVARFSQCDRPDRKPEHESAESRYWHTPEGLIRESNHWGQVRENWWPISIEGLGCFHGNYPQALMCGFCPWEKFFFSDRLKIVPPDVLNKDGHRKGKPWLDFAERNPDAYLFKESEFAPVERMLDSIRRNAAANDLIFASEGENEVAIRWSCYETGILRRARLDRLLNKGVIADLKTSNDSRPQAFAKKAFDLGYHRQAATYREAVHAVTGQWMPFVFVVVEKDPPYGCEVFELDEDFLELGRQENLRLMIQLAECRESGVWQTKTHGGINLLEAPAWAGKQSEWEPE